MDGNQALPENKGAKHLLNELFPICWRGGTGAKEHLARRIVVKVGEWRRFLVFRMLGEEYYRLGACKHQTLSPLSSHGLQVQMEAPVDVF